MSNFILKEEQEIKDFEAKYQAMRELAEKALSRYAEITGLESDKKNATYATDYIDFSCGEIEYYGDDTYGEYFRKTLPLEALYNEKWWQELQEKHDAIRKEKEETEMRKELEKKLLQEDNDRKLYEKLRERFETKEVI